MKNLQKIDWMVKVRTDKGPKTFWVRTETEEKAREYVGRVFVNEELRRWVKIVSIKKRSGGPKLKEHPTLGKICATMVLGKAGE